MGSRRGQRGRGWLPRRHWPSPVDADPRQPVTTSRRSRSRCSTAACAARSSARGNRYKSPIERVFTQYVRELRHDDTQKMVDVGICLRGQRGGSEATSTISGEEPTTASASGPSFRPTVRPRAIGIRPVLWQSRRSCSARRHARSVVMCGRDCATVARYGASCPRPIRRERGRPCSSTISSSAGLVTVATVTPAAVPTDELGSERLLACPVLQIQEHLHWALGARAQQEHPAVPGPGRGPYRADSR